MTPWNINRSGIGGKDGPTGPMRPGAVILVCLFLVPFFLAGGSFLIQGIGQVLEGNPGDGWPTTGFAVIFLLMASGFLSLVIFGYRKSRATSRRVESFRRTPWMDRPEWADGRIKAGRGRRVLFMWAMAVFWNAVSSPLLFIFREEWEKGNKAILIGLLFPLVGVGLLIAAIRTTLQWRRFGNSELRLKTLPGRVGGVFQARLVVPGMATSIQRFDLRLVCIRRTVSRSGKNRTTREELLWESQRVAPRQVFSFESTGTCVPVYFRVPADQPETLPGNPAIVWKLEARASLPGIDYEEKFEVPVFDIRPDSIAESAPDPLEGHQQTLEAGLPPNLPGIRITETLNGVKIHFKAARNPGAIITLAFITAIWTGIFMVLLQSDAPLLFPVVWALFDTILVLGLVTSLFHDLRIEVVDRVMTIQHRLILPTVTRRFGPDDLSEIKAGPGMKSGRTQFYRIQVIPKTGRSANAGGGIKKKHDATWIAERLAIAMGL